MARVAQLNIVGQQRRRHGPLAAAAAAAAGNTTVTYGALVLAFIVWYGMVWYGERSFIGLDWIGISGSYEYSRRCFALRRPPVLRDMPMRSWFGGLKVEGSTFLPWRLGCSARLWGCEAVRLTLRVLLVYLGFIGLALWFGFHGCGRWIEEVRRVRCVLGLLGGFFFGFFRYVRVAAGSVGF